MIYDRFTSTTYSCVARKPQYSPAYRDYMHHLLRHNQYLTGYYHSRHVRSRQESKRNRQQNRGRGKGAVFWCRRSHGPLNTSGAFGSFQGQRGRRCACCLLPSLWINHFRTTWAVLCGVLLSIEKSGRYLSHSTGHQSPSDPRSERWSTGCGIFLSSNLCFRPSQT